MKNLFRIFLARVKANVWCLLHLGDCIMERSEKKPGRLLSSTTLVCVGQGSILKGTWKTAKVFYWVNGGVS